MIHDRWRMAMWCAAMTAGVAVTPRAPSLAAQDSVTIDFSAPVATLRGEIPDSILRDAVTRFNAVTATRTHGTMVIAAGNVTLGTLGVHRGILRVSGVVRGDVIVLNGDLRIDRGGRVEGDIVVLGGHLVLAPGAVHTGRHYENETEAPVGREPDGLVGLRRPRRGLTDYTTASATFTTGPVRTTVGIEGGTYNRVEGLPIRVGPSLEWLPDDQTIMRLQLTGILRTAGDPDGLRSDFGWVSRLEATRLTASNITLAVEAASQVVPMFDQAYGSLESGLGAFVLRRDYRDWFNTRGVGVKAGFTPMTRLTLSGGLQWTRERTLRAVDAFSVLRGTETWRPNPVIDDGRYRIATIGAAWDTRDDRARPASGFWIQGQIRRVMSDALTPVSLPSVIRDNVPTTGYGATEIDIDIRRYLRLNPQQAVHLRLAGGGWIGGDPLTVQRRRSIGGTDPLAGYDFRRVTCDRRRRPDPAQTALCDRQILFQAEFRRTIGLGLDQRIAGIDLGLGEPDVVLLADAGTAWVAGDGAGRVPSGRIQAFSEWRGDVGIGLEGRLFGVFLAKAVADDDSPRLSVRLNRRF